MGRIFLQTSVYTRSMNVVRTVVLLVSLAPGLGMAAGEDLRPLAAESATVTLETPAFPIHDIVHYTVKYLGVTCGHLYLSNLIEELDGRQVYHIVMTARNSKFFNRIYSVDIRIDSWIDAQTLSSVLYESTKTENGETVIERHEIDWKKGTVLSVENDVERTMDFRSEEPVLDPLAFVFRLHALATKGGDEIILTLLTSKGPVETVATVQGPEKKRTSRGRRMLVEIKPQPTDGTMFSKKGQFSLWIDPNESSPLYILDFRLSFGHLFAKIN